MKGKYELSTYHNLRHSTTKLSNTYRLFAIRSILWNYIRKRMWNQFCNHRALYSVHSLTNNGKRREKGKVDIKANLRKLLQQPTANSKRSAQCYRLVISFLVCLVFFTVEVIQFLRSYFVMCFDLPSLVYVFLFLCIPLFIFAIDLPFYHRRCPGAC